MKTMFLLSILFPAGLLAAFLGSSAARQDEPAEASQETVQGIHIVQTTEPDDLIAVQGEPLAPIALVPGQPMRVRTIQSAGGPGTFLVQNDDGAWTAQAEGVPISPQPATAFAFSLGQGDTSIHTQEAITKLRNAKTDEDKAEAREALQGSLGEEFDEFLKHQSDELDRMEKKLGKLRKQLDKRREAKDDLVSLKLQTLVNEVNGLGWPSGVSGTNLFSPGGGFARTFDSNLSFSTAAGAVAPAAIATPAVLPTVSAPAQPDEDGETEKETPAPKQPRLRKSAR